MYNILRHVSHDTLSCKSCPSNVTIAWNNAASNVYPVSRRLLEIRSVYLSVGNGGFSSIGIVSLCVCVCARRRVRQVHQLCMCKIENRKLPGRFQLCRLRVYVRHIASRPERSFAIISLLNTFSRQAVRVRCGEALRGL